MDAQTKLTPSYYVGKRDRVSTYAFLTDLCDRMDAEHRFQITTDGFVSIATELRKSPQDRPTSHR